MKHGSMFTWGAALSLVSITAAAADWPAYRGPLHNGRTPEQVVPWKGELRQIWKVPTPNGFSSFAVAGGRAFTQISQELEGVQREICIALDASNGSTLWSVPVGIAKYDHDGGNDGTPSNRGGDGPRSTPTVDGNRVYVLSSQLVLFCLDAATGREVWKKDLIREHAGRNITWKNAASPLVEGDLVYVAGGGPGQSLLAFRKADGQVAWKAGQETITHSTPVLATLHGIRQVVFFTQSGLVSAEALTGRLLWRQDYKFAVSTAMTPIVDGDVVYCSAGYGVGAGAFRISRSGGEFSSASLWRTPNQLPNHWSTPVVHDGHLYGMFSFKEYGSGPVKCVELSTGKEKWSQRGFGAGNCILSGDRVLALTDSGELVLFEANPTRYIELARTQVVSGKCWSTPVVSQGRIYVRSTREAVCLELPPSVSLRELP